MLAMPAVSKECGLSQKFIDGRHGVLPRELAQTLITDHPREVVLEDFASRTARIAHAHVFGVAVPRPVHAAFAGHLVDDDGSEALARLLLRDVRADGLHERWEEEVAKPLALLAEERRRRNAPWVHGVEDDACFGVQPPVKLEHRHHVERLRVFVGLGAVEWRAVHHLLPRTRPQTSEVADVCHRLDQRACDCVPIARDRANDTHAAFARLLQDGQQELDEQKVAEVVHLQRHLVAIVRKARLWVCG
mmetsp:Transcript_32795/g.76552  ORF Transcript_32795/g.76552 Transcript_32795/m.76552 type:complete len:247 (-) Transcript_32795:602-1342(-)